MKKKHVILLVLFTVFALFTKCSNQKALPTDPVLAIHKSAMPYFNLIDRNSIDSIMSTRVGNNFAEIVFFKDGSMEAFHTYLAIKNITLRKYYTAYRLKYNDALTTLNYHYKKNEVNFILFNGFLFSNEMPMLTKMDYAKEIKNKGSTDNSSPPTVSNALGTAFIIGFILFIVSQLILVAFSKNKPKPTL